MEPRNLQGQLKEMTKEELWRYKHRCMNPACKRKAWLEDWTGWRWCAPHWYRSMRCGGGNKWFFIKTTRIFL